MTFTASLSGSFPATTAAAISPIEWPMTAEGTTPYDSQTRASATCTAKIAGIDSMGSGLRPSSMSCQIENPASSTSSGSRSSMASAKAGSSSSSRVPISGRCDPYPENTQTGRPGTAPSAVPETTPGCGSPAASARSPSSNPARSRATTAARARPRPARRPNVAATSADSTSASVSQSASRAAWSRMRSAWVSERAKVRTGAGSWAGGTGSAASRIRWAFVPPKPKPETPARGGWSRRGHGVVSATTDRRRSSKGMCGLGSE